jgi:hypothetical protein
MMVEACPACGNIFIAHFLKHDEHGREIELGGHCPKCEHQWWINDDNPVP